MSDNAPVYALVGYDVTGRDLEGDPIYRGTFYGVYSTSDLARRAVHDVPNAHETIIVHAVALDAAPGYFDVVP